MSLIQRCRIHKVRNVVENLAGQTAAVMRASFKMASAKKGREKLQAHAAWLKSVHTNAAGSLLEGIDEMFTVNALGFTPVLTRCLATTRRRSQRNAAGDRAPCEPVARSRHYRALDRARPPGSRTALSKDLSIATSGFSRRRSGAPSNRLIGTKVA